MTYLHDKNIVHGRLTSVNIYIELNQRVKISLIDNDEQPIASATSKPYPGSGSLGFNLPALTYLSPELIRTIEVVSRRDQLGGTTNKLFIDTAELSRKSDIFSFGTLLFELFEERFPFGEPLEQAAHLSACSQALFALSTPLGFATSRPQIGVRDRINLSASELIYQIGSGQIGPKNLQDAQTGSHLALVKHIISACWLQDPLRRPNFRQLSFVDNIGFRLNQHSF